MKFPIDGSDETLTDRSLSIAMDTGMYLGAVLVSSLPGTSWIQEFGSKNSIDYGQPVVKGFGQMKFNPVRMCVTMSFGMLNGQTEPNSLVELYDIWAEMRT